MRRAIRVTSWGLLAALAGGCANDHVPPPERVEASRERSFTQENYAKPLPAQTNEGAMPSRPFSDPPLVSQRVPEEQAFVNAYNAVGRPRILVFVNRTPQVEGNAPAYYDEAAARGLDYAAMENILADWLSADGRVALISPAIGRQLLNDQQARELQGGRANAGRDVANQVDAHVLVQVQAQPTRQTRAGLEVRVVAEAIDLKHGGASLARAVVDVLPPLDKPQINTSTRFLARKLMDGMIGAWQSFGAPPAQGAPAPAAPAPSSPILPQNPTIPPAPSASSAPAFPPESGSRPIPPDGVLLPDGATPGSLLAPNSSNPLPGTSQPASSAAQSQPAPAADTGGGATTRPATPGQ